MANTILTILLIAASVLLIVLVFMQDTKDTGLGALAGSTDSDTYWKRNKERSKEGVTKKLTVLATIAMVALTIALHFVS